MLYCYQLRQTKEIKMQTRITKFTGKVQSQGTNSIVPQTMYSVEIEDTNGEWQSSGVYQGNLWDAERRQAEFEAGTPHWFFEDWFNKVTS